MGKKSTIGELEQLVLLSILGLEGKASARRIREKLRSAARRSITRGALYRTLDRLGEKELLDWDLVDPSPERGGHSRRIFSVTPEGLQALRSSKEVLLDLWSEIPELAEGQ